MAMNVALWALKMKQVYQTQVESESERESENRITHIKLPWKKHNVKIMNTRRSTVCPWLHVHAVSAP